MSARLRHRNLISVSPITFGVDEGVRLPGAFYFGYFYFARPGAVALRQEVLA
jgi:hypothetical protein